MAGSSSPGAASDRPAGSQFITPAMYMSGLRARAPTSALPANNSIITPANDYTGQIEIQQAPQMDLMQQLKMYQQYKGGHNELEQKPQSSNPYQQMQDNRYQRMLRGDI